MPTYYPPGTRKGNRTFGVRGTIDGARYEIATDALDQESAEEAWIEFRRAVRQGGAVADRETATFADAVTLYEAARDLSKSERRYIAKLQKHFGAKRLASLKPADLIAAANAIYPKASPQTRNRQAIAPAAAIIHMAARNSLCDHMLVERLKESDPFRPIVYPWEVERAIKAARGPLKIALITLAYQGWRITETLMVKRENFEPENARVRRWVSKSRKWKWAALDPVVCREWKKLPEREDGRMFPWTDRWAFYRDAKPLFEALKIEWTPHMSRRGFATALIEAGSDLKSIQVTGGWEDLKSVLVYASVDLAQSRKTLAKLRGIGGRKGGRRAKSA